jgi:hypothetical protein
MRKSITLRTGDGKRIHLRLDNWGGGTDRLFRRWTREPDGWHCIDTGEIAQPASLFGWAGHFNSAAWRH